MGSTRPGINRCQKNQKPNGDTNQSIGVLGPGFHHIETSVGIAQLSIDFLIIGR